MLNILLDRKLCLTTGLCYDKNNTFVRVISVNHITALPNLNQFKCFTRSFEVILKSILNTNQIVAGPLCRYLKIKLKQISPYF